MTLSPTITTPSTKYSWCLRLQYFLIDLGISFMSSGNVDWINGISINISGSPQVSVFTRSHETALIFLSTPEFAAMRESKSFSTSFSFQTASYISATSISVSPTGFLKVSSEKQFPTPGIHSMENLHGSVLCFKLNNLELLMSSSILSTSKRTKGL